jgi:PAS domain-containing protein
VVVVFDEQWRFVYANLQWEKVTGLSRELTVGKILWEYAPNIVGSDVCFIVI